MATPVKRGSDEPLRQWWQSDWSPEQGGVFQTEYKGINPAKMSVLASQLATAGYRFTLRSQFGVATLTASIASSNIPGGGVPPGSDITDKWEVAVDSEKPDLTKNEFFLTLVQANDSATAGATGENKKSVQIIQAMVESSKNPVLIKSDGSEDITAKNVTPWRSFHSKLKYSKLLNSTGQEIASSTLDSGINVMGAYPNLKNFADDYFDGRTNFLKGKYVLRHHTNAPSNYNLNVADFNVERIYTIAQLLSEVQSTSLWILPLPSYLAFKISNYPVPLAQRANYMWGALKTRSSATTAALGRIEILTEYIIDSCPIHTYGRAT